MEFRDAVRAAFALAVLSAGCTTRGCATCAGYVAEEPLQDVDEVRIALEQKSTGETIAAPHGPIHFSMAVTTAESGPCRKLSDATTITLNGIGGSVVRTGGARLETGGRGGWGGARCGGAAAEWSSAALFGNASPPGGADTVIVDDTRSRIVITLATGRPRVGQPARAGSDLTVAFDGLIGKVTRVDPCALRLPEKAGCLPLQVISRDGGIVTVKSTGLEPGSWMMVGWVWLEPKTRCEPARAHCASEVSYTMRLPFELAP